MSRSDAPEPPNRWAGITVSSTEATVVVVEVGEDGAEILDDQKIPLQQGDRPAAYDALYNRIRNLLRESQVSNVAIKESAAIKGMKKGHLDACEVRGVVYAAAAAVAKVVTFTKVKLTKSFGERSADEYLKDDDFFEGELDGNLKKGSREAALLILMGLKAHA